MYGGISPHLSLWTRLYLNTEYAEKWIGHGSHYHRRKCRSRKFWLLFLSNVSYLYLKIICQKPQSSLLIIFFFYKKKIQELAKKPCVRTSLLLLFLVLFTPYTYKKCKIWLLLIITSAISFDLFAIWCYDIFPFQ